MLPKKYWSLRFGVLAKIARCRSTNLVALFSTPMNTGVENPE